MIDRDHIQATVAQAHAAIEELRAAIQKLGVDLIARLDLLEARMGVQRDRLERMRDALKDDDDEH